MAFSEPIPNVAIVGGGPAGLMAAEVLSAAGVRVGVYDRMPTMGRKFLMAGRGGLNLTHSEPFDAFVSRYGAAAAALRPMLEGFPPAAMIAWAEDLGQPTFVGSSGRIFPKAMKASPLLRAWLGRLMTRNVQFHPRHEWQGWDESNALLFHDGDGQRERVDADAAILALGGASWPRLGSNGAWTQILARRHVAVTPMAPSNCGFIVRWSDVFRERFAGQPLKNIALRFGRQSARGDCMVTEYGLEGGAVYALSAPLREAIAEQGAAQLHLDLRPDMTRERLTQRLERPRGGQSLSNVLRKSLNLSPLEIHLLREVHGVSLDGDAAALAQRVKNVPLTLTATHGLSRAISTAGGVAFESVDENLMVRAMPGVFVAGEMLDWEAPTGGYLLQASMATAAFAANSALVWLLTHRRP